MSEIRDILVEQVERLLADRTSPALLRAAEAGTWPEALWAEAEALGLPLAMVPEDQGGAGLGWADAAAVWHVLGRHAAPIPLGESMAAAALLSAAGIAAPAGFIGLGIGSEPVAWGRRASHLAVAPGARWPSMPRPAGSRAGASSPVSRPTGRALAPPSPKAGCPPPMAPMPRCSPAPC
ncbi:acyl-CoA dehydrogenase family protein [Paeniroseomonas aquatica]|uniref:acyl-CoA dehydrogenase family protein n=1 Tax=Paeniroseomonas aquatica TaxID=373043 RepID=UPI0036236095